MDIYKAQAIGSLIQGSSFCGHVVSIYSKAVNILHPGGYLISLVKDLSQMTALSIQVSSLFRNINHGTGEMPQKVKNDDEAFFEGKRLVIGEVIINLVSGELWTGTLSCRDVAGFRFWKLPLFYKALLLEGKKGGLLGVIDGEEDAPHIRRCSQILSDLTLRQGKFFDGLSQLIGLGIGFTPSGDDFISGVLLGEKTVLLLADLAHNARGSRTLECETPLIHKDEIGKALGKTNCGGKTLLKQALLGHFPAYLREISRGLSQASNLEEMRKVVIKVGTHGETSGTDASVGLLWFLDLCKKGIGSRD